MPAQPRFWLDKEKKLKRRRRETKTWIDAPVSSRMPFPLIAQLKLKACSLNRTPSEIICSLVEEYLASPNGLRKQAVYDIATVNDLKSHIAEIGALAAAATEVIQKLRRIA